MRAKMTKRMSRVRFDIPAYDTAIQHFVGQVIHGFMSLDSLLGQISRLPSNHKGPIRNVRGSTPLDQGMMRIESAAALATDAIRHTDIEAYTTFLYQLAESHIAAVAPQFYKTMAEVTTAVGNVVDAGGRPFSWDYCNDLLEKMAIDFDDDGKPTLPTIVMHPDLFEKIKNIEPTQEQLVRKSEILERKRVEFYAQKRTRRLS